MFILLSFVSLFQALVTVDTQSEKEEDMETDAAEVVGSVSIEEIEQRMQQSEDKCSYNKQVRYLLSHVSFYISQN